MANNDPFLNVFKEKMLKVIVQYLQFARVAILATLTSTFQPLHPPELWHDTSVFDIIGSLYACNSTCYTFFHCFAFTLLSTSILTWFVCDGTKYSQAFLTSKMLLVLFSCCSFLSFPTTFKFSSDLLQGKIMLQFSALNNKTLKKW